MEPLVEHINKNVPWAQVVFLGKCIAQTVVLASPNSVWEVVAKPKQNLTKSGERKNQEADKNLI